ncbi:ammonium transporter [Mucilaginibacter limnophilus]|uniref:Ammonium transporter n=1 Tax=Mucilaginibacter limnophilus TaxID=1932778 RepID=A0A437MKJ0_9SPHI|nr:ammonium transporter [Mucilaginibacter limnophilus]RVT98172.1 ammonium transporter [Mucilaginibacter limnophilus]
MKKILPFLLLIVVVVLALLYPGTMVADKPTPADKADTAWLLISTALVLLMTPGLAFFYGGMVRKKNVISTMLQSFVCMGLITIIWVVFGFSLAFGEDIGGGFLGNPASFFMMQNTTGVLWGTIPVILFAMFQLKFAVITPALITGAFAERIRFNSYLIFITLFIIIIYAPLAHATWHPDGYFFKLGVLDFAGGTVVHMSAGWAALASAIYLKKRNEEAHTPARISYVILGTGLLWFGWFGFNAGSALGANELASTALATTTTASAAAAISWIFFDMLRGKKPSALGACIGAVVGLVAITPAAGFVTVSSSLVIGIVAAVVSNLVVIWRTKTNIDDTLDVFPCHGVGGMMGMILTGVFATKSVNGAGAEGLFYGSTELFVKHLIALVAVSAFAFVGSFILLKVTDLISPLRVTPEEELVGLDVSQHDEEL